MTAPLVIDASVHVPTPSQFKALTSRAKVVALLGGYGSGKTRTGAEMVLDLAAANPGCDGMIVAPTWGILHRVTLRAFYDSEQPALGACPREAIAEHVVGKRYLRLVNGTRIYYGSADRPGTLEGPNLAFWWLDEGRLVRPEAWRVLVGRLRDKRARRLQGVVTTTPAPGWLQDEFGTRKEGREAIHISTRENASNLAPGFVEDLERTYSKRLAQALIEGRFGASETAVYDAFDFEKLHGVDFPIPAGLPVVGVVDFGRRCPAVTFWHPMHTGRLQGLDGSPRKVLGGTWVAVDELHPSNVTTYRLADEVKARIAERRFKVLRWYCDPAGRAAQAAIGIGDAHIWERAGFVPLSWCLDDILTWIPRGVELVDGLLLNARDETRLYVAKHLGDNGPRGLVNSFRSYSYPPARNGQPVSDHPVKDGVTDHAMDTARYLAINEVATQADDVPRYVRTR